METMQLVAVVACYSHRDWGARKLSTTFTWIGIAAFHLAANQQRRHKWIAGNNYRKKCIFLLLTTNFFVEFDLKFNLKNSVTEKVICWSGCNGEFAQAWQVDRHADRQATMDSLMTVNQGSNRYALRSGKCMARCGRSCVPRSRQSH